MKHVDKADQILFKLDEILRRLDVMKSILTIEGEAIMSALDDLTAQVTATTTLEASVVTLVQGIPALIAAAGTDPTKLAALQQSLKNSAQTLANAVAANTPAAA